MFVPIHKHVDDLYNIYYYDSINWWELSVYVQFKIAKREGEDRMKRGK
jgi:hypothetical protein